MSTAQPEYSSLASNYASVMVPSLVIKNVLHSCVSVSGLSNHMNMNSDVTVGRMYGTPNVHPVTKETFTVNIASTMMCHHLL